MIRYLLLALAFFVGFAHAETKPATQSSPPKITTWHTDNGVYFVPDLYFEAPASLDGGTAACKSFKPSGASEYVSFGINAWNDAGNCAWRSSSGSSLIQFSIVAVKVCPTGSTASGSSCVKYTCDAGWTGPDATNMCTKVDCGAEQYVGSDGQCKCNSGASLGADNKTCCPIAGSGGGSPMMWCYVPNMAAAACDSTGANGCNVRCNNVTFQKGVGDSVQVYPKLALGQSCTFTGSKAAPGVGGSTLTNDELHEVDKATKKPDAAKTPEGCLASGQGYVTDSAGTRCVGGGDTGVTKKNTATESSTENGKNTSSETKTENSQGPNGTGSETATTTTKNADGTTTTTTTTTTKNADGTVTKSTESVTKDEAGNIKDSKSSNSNKDGSTFCTENPNSAVCKGFEDTCKDNPERLGCMDAGPVPNEDGLVSSEFGISSLTPVSLAASNICPQGPPLPHGWGYFSFDGICQLATGIRPVVLAMAWLAAGLILMGAFRES